MNDDSVMRKQIASDPIGSAFVHGIGGTWPEGHPERELYEKYKRIVQQDKEPSNLSTEAKDGK
jgi:hypothetical protein